MKNYGTLAQRPFFKGDVIRTWRISQSSVAVSQENLDVEYYRLDYQFYQRRQLGSVLVVLYIKCSNISLLYHCIGKTKHPVPSLHRECYRSDNIYYTYIYILYVLYSDAVGAVTILFSGSLYRVCKMVVVNVNRLATRL